MGIGLLFGAVADSSMFKCMDENWNINESVGQRVTVAVRMGVRATLSAVAGDLPDFPERFRAATDMYTITCTGSGRGSNKDAEESVSVIMNVSVGTGRSVVESMVADFRASSDAAAKAATATAMGTSSIANEDIRERLSPELSASKSAGGSGYEYWCNCG